MSIVVPANKVAQTELDLANRVCRSAQQVKIRLVWRQPVWADGRRRILPFTPGG
ncbi:hypothetical protein JZM24_13340 [Candidatus Sodalis endolongispinus]|uniref:Uncharacterized protein n=1 Tax=Candidatus Sodalis endolongispinus TaxID=2812662 RepID=A0ABS5YFS1_9GAMM|nr:hypothetical protein [Candidatus Sodalis endolongispinus]MBT9432866.1 hypothetical protein [Candidatus Sodalis endolongispinus]